MHIFKCVSCYKYTFKERCPQCGGEVIKPRPPKFSLQDKYAEYKRKVKKEELKKKGLY